ncbi:hypothetical protein [Nocardioides sp. SR21]|uniref:hypothetical protein n=1 Tax=Nocardioides sp. SR21 TaxID=2919501 RepID=UPI001FA99264|nr:hypothetical protein [Nocardioides sp. SR21]
MSTDLIDQIRTRVDALPVPPGDLDAVRRSGGRIRTRRRVAAGAGVAAVVCAAAFALWPAADDSGPGSGREIQPIGPLDYSHGLRAYADPGGEIHLGGRTLTREQLGDLDTQGTATPYGVVFSDRGLPSLLEESGEITALEPDSARGDYWPTPMADSQQPLVAYGATIDGKPHVVVRDLEQPEDPVAVMRVPGNTQIEAIDGGLVILSTSDGSRLWDPRAGDPVDLGGPRTRIADFRNGVLLYDGPAPDGPAAADLRLVPGAIDAQLTFDGGHILYWSNKLESTDGSPPIVLDEKATFFNVDTDGSILAAAFAKGGGAEVYDCELPSGRCEPLGHLPLTGGDPMFMGNDM